VIGINPGFMTNTTNSQGVSISLPFDLAWKIAQRLLRDGRDRHPRLGANVQDPSDPRGKSSQFASPSGAIVIDDIDGSPADKAGLETGDVNLSVNESNRRISRNRRKSNHVESGPGHETGCLPPRRNVQDPVAARLGTR
jgi:serine protease Do